MNFLFLSPHFPPNYFQFCRALRRAGANVLGIGDAPYDALQCELKAVLTEYYFLPDMSNYDSLFKAVAYLIHRHGRIDRLDSQTEYWLGLEARLREDFNVHGQKPADLAINRSKLAMKRVYREAGIPTPEGEAVTSPDQVRTFAARHHFPIIFKPDVGVGAAQTFRVDDWNQLEAVLGRLPEDYLRKYLMEDFVHGRIVTYDGLTGREGKIIFSSSHSISDGVMEILTQRKGMHYYYMRQMSPAVEALGKRTVEAFKVRERFFHAEFFQTAAGDLLALEINIRPPGGFSMDMMNFACDVDLYDAWARLVVHGDEELNYERRYNCANVARRDSFNYRRPHDEVISRLGPMLMSYRPMPQAFSDAMGDHAYIIRHHDLDELKKAIAFIEETA